MCQKLSTRVRPPEGREFTAASLGRIANNLAREYGDLARAVVGRDATGPYLEVSRTPVLRSVRTTADAETTSAEGRTSEEEA